MASSSSPAGAGLHWDGPSLALPAPSASAIRAQLPPRNRSVSAMRSACTQIRMVVHSPTIKACCQSPELVVSGQISRAIASIRCAKSGLLWLIVPNACLRLLQLARALPAAVRGPLLFCAFLRLASICFCELISAPPWRQQLWVQLPQSPEDTAPAPGKPDPAG